MEKHEFIAEVDAVPEELCEAQVDPNGFVANWLLMAVMTAAENQGTPIPDEFEVSSHPGEYGKVKVTLTWRSE